MPLWKWILLLVFGSALFLFLSQTVPVVGSFSNNRWIKALLLLLGANAVLGLYAVWVKVFERRKVSELRLQRAFRDLLTFILSSLTVGAVHLMTVDFWTAMAISAEAGFMLAAAYKFRNNLWIPIGIHWAWNFTLGPVFGVGVSGISEDAYAIIPEISPDEVNILGIVV